MPKVSVIIPVYGVEKYIERCARSLFEQTLDDIEYLFIDDCTPDNSIGILTNVLEEYPNRKSQVIIHRMKKNSGQAAVREWGMRNATGDFIIHCDSDDWVNTDMYRQMYDKAIQENADCVICDYYTYDDNGNKKYCKSIGENFDSTDLIQLSILQQIASALWNKLIRKSVIPINKIVFPKYNMGEDFLFTLQYFYYSSKVIFIDNGLYNYYVNENSITNSISDEKILYKFTQSIGNMASVLEFINNEKLNEKYSQELEKLKYSKRNNIRPLIKDKKYYNLWRNTFPEINKYIISNKYISIKEKAKFIATYLRIIKH